MHCVNMWIANFVRLHLFRTDDDNYKAECKGRGNYRTRNIRFEVIFSYLFFLSNERTQWPGFRVSNKGKRIWWFPHCGMAQKPLSNQKKKIFNRGWDHRLPR